MAEHLLVPRKTFDHNNFSWVFLIWYLVYGFVTLLFLLYYNRLLASLISHAIRLYTWHYYRVYVNIQSLQISPLAGRIFFKGIRYYGRNETILIHDGHITWRYWLLRVQELGQNVTFSERKAKSEGRRSFDDGVATEVSPEEGAFRAHGSPDQLPCRVLAKVRGVQWFIYNRSPVYDTILQSMLEPDDLVDTGESTSTSTDDISKEAAEHNGNSGLRRRDKEAADYSGNSRRQSSTISERLDTGSTASTIEQDGANRESQRVKLPSLLNILPVEVDCGKAAVVMGNQCTKSVLVAKVDGAHGQFTARASSSADIYKQVIDFDFHHPTIHFKHNKDYRGSLFREGQNLCTDRGADLPKRASWYDRLAHPPDVRRASELLKNLIPHRRGSIDDARRSHARSTQRPGTLPNSGAPGQTNWLGLTRYLDDDDDVVEQERWRSVDYAQVPNIVDSPSISMSYYWDVPGTVPSNSGDLNASAKEVHQNINGDHSPDWGIELRMRGGIVNYGPWADRQRADLQSMFFPALHKDAKPAAMLSPGKQRVSTELKVLIIVEEQVTMRIPHREESKDWKWKGRNAAAAAVESKGAKKPHLRFKKATNSGQDLEARPFGWVDAKVQPDSTVNFVIDMVAGDNGYQNAIDVDLKGLELSSSVNHAMFWRSQSQIISCDLSNPLGWNALRNWHIDVHDKGMELFVLRDHMFLLTDLIDDWASGPPSDYHTFVPFKYSLNLHFLDFRLYLNANDSNIIDNPADTDDNTFIVLWGQELSADLSIPMEHFRPSKNKVLFDVEARDGGLELLAPPWNTQRTFLGSKDITSLRDLELNGSFTYFTSSSPSLTDVLLMNVYGSSLKIQLYGFLIRYFMNIKENYFGDDIHFRTLEEHQNQLYDPKEAEADAANPEHHKRPSNDLDTILTIRAEKCSALLPGHLYSAEKGIKLEIFSATADLRITNYYMDLAVGSSPISVLSWTGAPKAQDLSEGISELQMFVDGLQVVGHRLFGLPPDEPTYVCNWDFEIGQISGECSVDFLRMFTLAIRCFVLTFDDKENALTRIARPVIHDVTFLRARLNPISVALRMESCALLLRTHTVSINLNDWAGPLFSDRLNVMIPEISLAMAEIYTPFATKDSARTAAKTYAYIRTSIELDKVSRTHDFQRNLDLQQSHIALHDARTDRVPWLVHSSHRNPPFPYHVVKSRLRSPAMIYPTMPNPVYLSHERASLSSSQFPGTWSSSNVSNGSSFLLKRSPSESFDSRSQNTSEKKRFGRNEGKTQTRQSQIVPSKLSQDAAASASGSKSDSISASFKRHTSGQPGFAFSSPFKTPYFPLLAIIPDTSEVPQIPRDVRSDSIAVDDDVLRDLQSHGENLDIEQSSIMVELKEGLQAMCTPKALVTLTQIQEQMQGDEVLSLFDGLQLDIIDGILSDEAKRKGGSTKNEIRIFLPFLSARFANVSDVSSDAVLQEQERYDLTIQDLSFITRSMSIMPEEGSGMTRSQLAVHVMVEHLSFSARESTTDSTADQAVVSMQLSDSMLWVVRGSTMSAELQIGTIDIVSASRRVNYITSLLHHTAVLADNLTQRFLYIIQNERRRLQLFILLLTKQDSSVSDPPFLSGASYVLRSAKNHLRLSHSWWMISHLRYNMMNLSEQAKNKLYAQYTHKLASCPEDAARQVAAYFEKLHTWDLGHATSTVLMHRIFGKRSVSPAHKGQEIFHLNATLNVRRLRVIVEPGRSQNEILVERCIVGFSLGSPTLEGPTSNGDDRLNSVSAYCAKVAIRLNWSLCELVENVIESAQSTHYYGLDRQGATPKTQAPKDLCLHLTTCVDMSVLSVAAINVRAVTVCRGLKASMVSSTAKNNQKHGSTSILVDADVAKCEVHSHNVFLSEYNLHQPRIFGCQETRSQGEISYPWKLVCSGKRITFQILKTPLELSEIVDNIIQHEIAHLTNWSRNLPLHKSASSKQGRQNATKPPKAHIALFLDSYSIVTNILPSLLYEIRGDGVRASVQSAVSQEALINVNLELKEHSHIFKSDRVDKTSEISTLPIPTINSCLKLDFASQQTLVVLRVLVGLIKLSASSLHAIFDAVNQPAMISLGKSLQTEIELIQRHLNIIHVKKKTKKVGKSPTTSMIAFSASAIVDGVTIHAITPDSPSLGQAADLKVDLGRILMQGTNLQPDNASILSIPEVQIQLKSIQVNLLRTDDARLRACGDISVALLFRGTSRETEPSLLTRAFDIKSSALNINLYTETASAVVAIIAHLKETLKTIELPTEIKDLRKLGRRRLQREGLLPQALHGPEGDASTSEFGAMYSLVMNETRVAWKIGDTIPISPIREPEDLVLSFRTIDLATKQGNAARLLVQDFQLQMAPPSMHDVARSLNSALLPEVFFNVAYKVNRQDLRLAFQAVGKTFDLQLTSQSILPANDLRRSIAAAAEQLRVASNQWRVSKPVADTPKPTLLSKKKLTSLLIYADFAGAVVHIQGRNVVDPQSTALSLLQGARRPQHGKYNQFVTEQSSNSSATLKSPGVALKVEYKDNKAGDESLSAEMKVSASSNTLYPTVVPLVMEISSSIKEIMGEQDGSLNPQGRRESKITQPKFLEDEKLRTGDPSSLLGNCKLNLGLRICQQDFSLSCQPIARVAARARFEDMYFTVNTVQSDQYGKFYTMTAAFTGLETSVQHVYSRESSGSLNIESIVISFMNSKHVTAVNGMSVILRISPVKAHVNAKQLQDFLLFREIWVPPEIRNRPSDHEPSSPGADSRNFVIQRYQQLAATSTFPWNATLSIAEVDVQLDLGSSIGKSRLQVSAFWVSSQKSSDREQNLCIGLDRVAADSKGRMNGLIEMQNFKVRSVIKWTVDKEIGAQTPLVQASTSFDHLSIKAGFDFQSFLVADISSFDFLMYNVRNLGGDKHDRLVSVLQGDRVQVFCTSTSASQAYSLVQAFQRLIEEKQKAYEASLADLEKFLRRKSTLRPDTIRRPSSHQSMPRSVEPKSPLRLQTDVVVSLKAVNVGAFPSTFLDNQVLKVEAFETSARFAVYLEKDKIHSTLSMALGQLRVALSSVDRGTLPKTLGDVSVADVVAAATGSRGGTILKVPRLVATMQTWQDFESTHIDYIFKSEFQGKVDVGWNYSRISYIRGMHASHVRTLAQRLGKPLPQSALQITGLEGDDGKEKAAEGGQEKITAVVNVPQSKYQYTALQPPVIETPQLRDMGDATPPLEWIGLHRERLPTLTHQVVIVTLLEVAKEVDDAYSRILGSS